MRQTSDDDWIRPAPISCSCDACNIGRTPCDGVPVGVFRIEQHGEQGQRFGSLIEAASEPPMSPEAEIRGAGGCLAECHPDLAAWVMTTLGRERLDREVRGAVAA